MNTSVISNDIHRHNWVTYLLSRFFLRTRERQISYKLYQYLRFVDDLVDESGADTATCLRYINEQRSLARELYNNGTLCKNTLLGQIIAHDRQNGRKFQKCIDLMMDVFEFDARRKHTVVSTDALRTYSLNLARAYTQFLVYFVEPNYQHTHDDVLLAHACHLTHMIRDLNIDNRLGYINITQEDIETYTLQPGFYNTDQFSAWLKNQVTHISFMIKQGKKTLCKTQTLTIKFMGLLYCFRYEIILHQIKRAGFRLQNNYHVRLSDSIQLVFQCITTCLKHFFHGFSL